MIQILDASVGVKWYLNEPDSQPARQILHELSNPGARTLVPELFYFEVYAVCMRRHPDPKRFASEGMPLLMRLPLMRVPLTKEIAELGSEFVRLGLTGYDAIYAALAKLTKGYWVTYDRNAAKKLKQPNWIKVLSD